MASLLSLKDSQRDLVSLPKLSKSSFGSEACYGQGETFRFTVKENGGGERGGGVGGEKSGYGADPVDPMEEHGVKGRERGESGRSELHGGGVI